MTNNKDFCINYFMQKKLNSKKFMNNKLILNLGCGEQIYGTHRIDIYKTKTTTHIHDLNEPFPFPDNYFDEIFGNCILEHIQNLKIFCDECYRILKKGGYIYIHTDYAGYILFHTFKRYEHNIYYEKMYNKGNGFGHEKELDNHYHLFVESHLRLLFSKFKDMEFRYTFGGRNLLLNFILLCLPFYWGAGGIIMEAEK